MFFVNNNNYQIMGLKKGNTNNPNGRPKGSVNKINESLRATFSNIIENNLETFNNDLLVLQPKDRISMLIKMAEFILPKLRSVESESVLSPEEYQEFLKHKKTQERYNNMTDEEKFSELQRLRKMNDRAFARSLKNG